MRTTFGAPGGGVGTGGHHGSESLQSLPIFPRNSMLATVHPRAGPTSSHGPVVTGGHRTVFLVGPIWLAATHPSIGGTLALRFAP